MWDFIIGPDNAVRIFYGVLVMLATYFITYDLRRVWQGLFEIKTRMLRIEQVLQGTSEPEQKLTRVQLESIQQDLHEIIADLHMRRHVEPTSQNEY